MRNFNENERMLIAKLLAARNERSLSVNEFQQQNYFTAEAGRALIIQGQSEYAVFFLATEIFNDTDKRTGEVKSFFEMLLLFSWLVNNGYLLLYKEKKEKIYYIQDDFDSPKILNNTIILNKKGYYTSVPDTIHDSSKNVIYKGIEFRGDQYALIQNVTTGSMIVSESIHELVIDEHSAAKENVPGAAKSNSPDTAKSDAPASTGTKHHTKLLLVAAMLVVAGLLGLGTFLFFRFDRFDHHLNDISTAHHSLHDTLASVAASVRELNTKKDTTHPGSGSFSTVLYGVDISKWNGDEASEITSKDSIAFVICKATEGIGYVDPDFDRNWSTITANKFISGVYHFYRSDADPVAQAEHFWSTISMHGRTDISPIVDIEEESVPANEKPDPLNVQKDLLAFLKRLEEKCKRTPIVYTDKYFADTYLVNDSLGKYPLWLAEYTNAHAPSLPKTWQSKGYMIWQRRDNYFIDSHTSDFDIYYGPRTELLR